MTMTAGWVGAAPGDAEAEGAADGRRRKRRPLRRDSGERGIGDPTSFARGRASVGTDFHALSRH